MCSAVYVISGFSCARIALPVPIHGINTELNASLDSKSYVLTNGFISRRLPYLFETSERRRDRAYNYSHGSTPRLNDIDAEGDFDDESDDERPVHYPRAGSLDYDSEEESYYLTNILTLIGHDMISTTDTLMLTLVLHVQYIHKQMVLAVTGVQSQRDSRRLVNSLFDHMRIPHLIRAPARKTIGARAEMTCTTYQWMRMMI